jgi:hypothetical protein
MALPVIIALTESGLLFPFALRSIRVAPSFSSFYCRFLSYLFPQSAAIVLRISSAINLAESHVPLPSRRAAMLYRTASHCIVFRAEPSFPTPNDEAHTVTQIDCHARGAHIFGQTRLHPPCLTYTLSR